jgi:hypothetical protein
MKNIIALLGLAEILLFSACSTSSPPTMVNTFDFLDFNFPLTPGTTWVYKGDVSWEEEDGVLVLEKQVTWKMEVLERAQRGYIRGFSMRGHPSDLVFYEEGRIPSEYAIIQVGLDKYYKTDLTAFQRLRDENDLLIELVKEHQIFLDFPLYAGKRICETAWLTGPQYCTVVEHADAISLGDVKNVSASSWAVPYILAYRSLPDHEYITFVPGIGIVGYEYGHHGTNSEVSLKLVEFHSGES